MTLGTARGGRRLGGGEGRYKIKMKESSNKIAEEISLVRNGVNSQA